MGYSLCVLGMFKKYVLSTILTNSLGCGTMGIAILSGVFDSLDSPSKTRKNGDSKWESHSPGTLSPIGPPDETVPTRFLACVRREETAEELHRTFGEMDGQSIEILAGKNVEGVVSADVVLLW